MKIKRRVKRNAEAGFTLMEILAVITLIAFLMVMVVPNIAKNMTEGKKKITKTQIGAISNLVIQYYTDCGTYPSTEEGLKALIQKPSSAPEGWNGPYTSSATAKFTDGWNRELKYKCPGDHNVDSFDLYSLGADGADGGINANADIGNW